MQFLASNWLYLIFIGVMAFVMVRGGGCCGGHSHSTHSNDGQSHGGGCCGGGSHDHHSNSNYEHQNHINQLDTVKDPICGMSVNPDTAIKHIVDGKTYYFCSESCRTEFVSKQKLI
jgi:YHS domain-containing protein